ncbi:MULTISPECIES: DUF262 and DUF1524 domain-containing protein [Serratia]|uniref:Uncharacterized conserved protein n=1 Tax=Serratia quinivorans TaxID=137545 RepID=A0A379Z8L9_9GAMM|nr:MULTISPECIES: DUF262 and DUF1524 domain-containing protein [Serratia]QBX67183.1 DUF262 domain-containing protein [Serratia quinivorans]RYM61462.1 hypothetical protein BSR03_12365 [Serratia proteamaculans]CAI1046072.1 Uncharacterized conserved protein [Serratia quinivorans]CAI1943232.1 Uncharacterized conserved protein [Serratia quinivorans]SUI57090.1 Uncharacterized conserved protein [Serratia quinivorans]
MKAKEAKLLDFLRTAPQLVIPIYQRLYSWGLKECEQLWDDIIRCGKDESNNGHFIGSVVYIEHGLYSVTSQSPLLIIDGQQRVTTASLLIAALAEAVGQDEFIEGFNQEQLRGFYLTNPLLSGEKRYKLVLSQTDNATLRAIVDRKSQPEAYSIRIKENFEFFQDKLKNKELQETVCKGLNKLIVVDISLQRGYDNPQLIFESMNSTGKKLSQADLIRNYILMGLDNERQTELYNDYWRKMELLFGQEAYSEQFDFFMRHYLTVKTGEIPKVDDVYETFKQHFYRSKQSVDSVVADIYQYAVYYCAIVLGVEKDKKLREVFQDIRELRMDVAYPLILELYNDYQNENLQHSEFVAVLRLIESYVFRRAVCAIPTNSMNKTFAGLSKSFKKDRYLESVQAAFMMLPSYRRFPNDDEFKREITHRDLYNFRSRSYWLKKFENFNHKERVHVDEYTIEHIMPQCDNNVEKVPLIWQKTLGTEWQRVWETWRHTLGNLTLTGYNSEYSNKSFADKRDMDGGFKHSPLRLNEGLSIVENWDEPAIQARAKVMAEKASIVWPAVNLPVEVLNAYKPEDEISRSYSIEDHPHLAKEQVNMLFDAFRKAVLALDPCVSEVFLKLYIAYKAEVNFVDVIPQAKRLLLSLNIPISELEDPRGLSRDVTKLGRWGNGDVEVAFENKEDLPYIMALVTQAFERQMES